MLHRSFKYNEDVLIVPAFTYTRVRASGKVSGLRQAFIAVTSDDHRLIGKLDIASWKATRNIVLEYFHFEFNFSMRTMSLKTGESAVISNHEHYFGYAWKAI